MRDRHGRALHADLDRLRRPVDGFRVRDSRRFRALVADTVPTLPEPLRAVLAGARVTVEAVPPAGTRLAEFSTAPSPRLVVYRRPLEARALTRRELLVLVRSAVGRAVAEALGRGREFEDEWDDLDDWGNDLP